MVPCGRKCSFWLAFLTQPWKSQPALGCFTIAPLNRLCRGEFLRKTLKKERLIKKHLFQVHWKVNLPPRIGCIRVTNASILFNDIFYPSVSHVSFSEGCWAVAHMVTFSEIVPHFERPVPAVLRVIFVSFNFFCTTAYLKKNWYPGNNSPQRWRSRRKRAGLGPLRRRLFLPLGATRIIV